MLLRYWQTVGGTLAEEFLRSEAATATFLERNERRHRPKPEHCRMSEALSQPTRRLPAVTSARAAGLLAWEPDPDGPAAADDTDAAISFGRSAWDWSPRYHGAPHCPDERRLRWQVNVICGSALPTRPDIPSK